MHPPVLPKKRRRTGSLVRCHPMTQILDLMRTLRSMPPLPNVAQRVLAIVRDPDYSIDNLVGVVRTDPALTTRILKLSNSSLFGIAREVTTVSDAVAYIGTRNLVKLVLVTCTAAYFQAARGRGFAAPAELWRHTLACATACQFLAERCGYEQPATAFTAGILHNVGKVAISQVIAPEVLEGIDGLPAPDGGDWVDREKAALGIDHATASGIVTDNWNLPVELRRAVRQHHDHGLLNQDELTCILHVADQTCLRLGIGAAFPTMDYAVDAAARGVLHLGDDDLEAVAAHVTEELTRSAELLNLDALDGR